MSLAQNIRKSYRDIQQVWTSLADSAFSKALPAAHDDTARGEFISAFISERGLTFPAAARQERPSR